MPAADPRLSKQGLVVLRMFANRPSIPLAGTDILKQTGLLSGTLYPILYRLDRAGWLSSEWEQITPHEMGRPRKRMYRLTSLGAQKTHEALNDLTMPVGRLGWIF